MEPHGPTALVSDPIDAPLSPVVEAEFLLERGLGVLGPGPFVLEIGFGRGELLLATAAEQPQRFFLGVEVSRKRVLKMERRVRRAGLANVGLVHCPAEYLLERVLPARSIDECWIHCPDPWPKKRHHRRRLLQPHTARLIAGILAPGATLRMSTDHPAYAEWIHEVLASTPELENRGGSDPWSAPAPDRPRTAYEEEWIADGRSIAYFSYVRRAGGDA